MVDGDRDRLFVKVDKVTKKAVVSQAKERGLKYTSDSPSAALKVSKKGDLTWLGANGSFEKAKWRSPQPWRRLTRRGAASGDYFAAADDSITGFFTADGVVAIGERIIVLKRTDTLVADQEDTGEIEPEASVSTEQPPPRYQDALSMQLMSAPPTNARKTRPVVVDSDEAPPSYDEAVASGGASSADSSPTGDDDDDDDDDDDR
ncbi:hypothetical protein FOZ63_003620, partial [Perkinsus olseni]